MGVEERQIGEGVMVVQDEPEVRSVTLVAGKFTLRDLTNIATAVAASNVFPGIKSQAQAFTLMMLADSMGLHPMTALRQFDMLPNGRPAMKSEALLAQHVAAGGTFKVTERSDERSAGTFGFKNNSVDVEFTAEDAKAAGLDGKDNYKHYRKDMYFWRMVARGVRSSGSGVGVGILTTEEAEGILPLQPEVAVTRIEADTTGRRAFGRQAIKPQPPASNGNGKTAAGQVAQPPPVTPPAEPAPTSDPAPDPAHAEETAHTSDRPLLIGGSHITPDPKREPKVDRNDFWNEADKALKGNHVRAIAAVQKTIDDLKALKKLPVEVAGWQDLETAQAEAVLAALKKA
jgi:hypothetical protein